LDYSRSGHFFIDSPEWGILQPPTKMRAILRNNETKAITETFPHIFSSSMAAAEQNTTFLYSAYNDNRQSSEIPVVAYRRPLYHTQDTVRYSSSYQFARCLLHYPRNGRRVVYLDDLSGSTTNLLSTVIHIPPNRLYCPHPDPNILKKMKKQTLLQATYSSQYLFEWIRDCDFKQCFDVGMDYSCSFAGNQHIKPQSDLIMLFKRGLLARDNGVLWLSVTGTDEATLATIPQFVEDLARDCGYSLSRIHEWFITSFFWIVK
jgi:hypothetical protein